MTTPEQIRMLAEAQMKDDSLDLLRDCDGAKLKVLLLEEGTMVCRYFSSHTLRWSGPMDRLYSETRPGGAVNPIKVTDSGRKWLRINGGEWIVAGGDAVKVKLRYDANLDRTEMQCVSIDERIRGSSCKPRGFTASNGVEVRSVAHPDLYSVKLIYVSGETLSRDKDTTAIRGRYVPAFKKAVDEADAAWAKELATVPCCVCGEPVDTRERDEGGDNDGAQLSDGRWACSHECWDEVAGPFNGPIVTALHELRDRLDEIERMIVGGGE